MVDTAEKGKGAGETPPEVSAHDTIDQIVRTAKRHSIPIRTSFLQQPSVTGAVTPGPLSSLVRAGDRRGLVLYLMLMTKASSGDFEVALPATVWARALGIWDPSSRSATSKVSKTWLRLEQHGLIERQRRDRRAEVRPLREDGSGLPYTHPGADKVRHLKVPHSLWTDGPEGGADRWYEILSLPELSLLMISLSMRPDFRLPFENAPGWYGISADTAMRGLNGLVDRQILRRRKQFKKAPLTSLGFTNENRYTLLQPFARTLPFVAAASGATP